ncbi:pectate lyase [Mesorhizobium sp. ZMM04-5]|uniref:Pectate lyase n=1 Tax=Mesorhizobium marinum TaxID=3228790 RepID=A0ABV3R6R9_9HYPH
MEASTGSSRASGWRARTPPSPLPEHAVVARPPGSAQELGACLVAASRASDSRRLLLEALGVAQALACVQNANGGWSETASPGPVCGSHGAETTKAKETLDDGTIPSILYFLFDLEDRLSELSIEPPLWLTASARRAQHFSIRSQREDGSWPQIVDDGKGYARLGTLNDDVTTGMIRVLIAAYRRNGNTAYLDAARRGGDFLLRAQGAGAQRAFGQQYDSALNVAPARKFEPAAYSSLETAYAINALIDLHLATGDGRYLAAARAAAAWLEASQTGPGEWARLYEIGTNKPIYALRAGRVTYELQDVPAADLAAYRWTGGRDVYPEIGLAFDRLERLDQGVEGLRALDRRIAADSLLAATPTARLPLVPANEAITAATLASTRRFAEHCAGLIALQMRDGTLPPEVDDSAARR